MSPDLIPNEQLALADLPAADADWDELQRFALTFDGYAANGSFDRCAEIANRREHASLSDLRTCLFFEQRSWRHCGDTPDADALKYIRSLLEMIRQLVTPSPDSQRMGIQLVKISYARLNARQKENFNFLKISAVLADYGFMTMRLSDDWQGADFIAQHVDGGTFLKVQLKSRLAFGEKYKGKDLYVAFHHEGTWYLYPHDELLARVLAETSIGDTVSWTEKGGYSFPALSQQLRKLLEPYRIGGDVGGAD